MSDGAKRWTLEGFVEHFGFVHNTMGDHKYAWILGAGASKSSGIPLGSELVDRWLKELYDRECNNKEAKSRVEDWATPDNLGRDQFRLFKWEARASFYPQIFLRRFSEYPAEGYAYLENVMSGKDPSPGYSILATVLSGQVARPKHAAPHNVVITTNFDNLVGDAISIYTDTFPLICGHESLAGFAGATLTRPLICKIHRDLLFSPQNDPRSLKRLKDAWGIALTRLFEHYTPLFIGYGGNDDTLMDLLESLEPGSIRGQVIWTYYEKGEPSERIRNVVAQHRGVLVPVPDFDLLMILLGEQMKIGLLDGQIERRSTERLERYRNRVESLDILKSPAVLNAFASMARRSDGWWAWERRASAETDPARIKRIYREAINHYPKSDELFGNFAVFLSDTLAEHDEAEALYKRALELKPDDPIYLANYAEFLGVIRKDVPNADLYYKMAIKHAPQDPVLVRSYAWHLAYTVSNLEEGAAYFKKAIDLDPTDAESCAAYAGFLFFTSTKADEAEQFFKKALALDPKHFGATCNYIGHLIGRGKIEEATTLLDKSKATIATNHKSEMAEMLLYEGMLALINGTDDTPAIKQLGDLFAEGFIRDPWPFDAALGFLHENVPREEYQIYASLAEGINSDSEMPDVDNLLSDRSAYRNTAKSRSSQAKHSPDKRMKASRNRNRGEQKA